MTAERVLTDDFKPFLKELLNQFPDEESEIFKRIKAKVPDLQSIAGISDIDLSEFNDFHFMEIFKFYGFLDGKYDEKDSIDMIHEFALFRVRRKVKITGLRRDYGKSNK